MTESFDQMVERLKKPGNDVLSSLTPDKCDAIHMTLGIAGEAGEIVDAVKKWCMYNKDLDRENVIEELGDIEFYMEGLRQVVGVSRNEVLLRNMAKLSTGKNARYRDGYSDAAAQERRDKA